MGCTFTERDLQSFAQQYARKYWNRDFDGKVELVNQDWKRQMGCYVTCRDGRKLIRMSRVRNLRSSNEAVLGTLKHELVHWFLHTTNKNFDDESEEFVKECLRIQAPLSHAKSAQAALGVYMKKNLDNYFAELRKNGSV